MVAHNEWLPYWTAQKDHIITPESHQSPLLWNESLPEFWGWLLECGSYLFKLLCEMLGIIQFSNNSVSPWTKRMGTRERLLCAESHVSFITTEVASAGVLILNSIRIILKHHVSSVVFGTCLWLHMSSKMKLLSLLHECSCQRPRWWCHAVFESLNGVGKLWEWGGHLRSMLLLWIGRKSS